MGEIHVLKKIDDGFRSGQWRVAIKGPTAARQFLSHHAEHALEDSWPWTPPVTLLGQSCFGFLEPSERHQLVQLIGRALSPQQIQHYAPVFAQKAQHCLHKIFRGQFRKDYQRQVKRLERQRAKQQQQQEQQSSANKRRRPRSLSPPRRQQQQQQSPISSLPPKPQALSRHPRAVTTGSVPTTISNTATFAQSRYDPETGRSHYESDPETDIQEVDKEPDHKQDHDLDLDDDEEATFGSAGPYGEPLYKVKWTALRSYTLDLVDGPVWNTNIWSSSLMASDVADENGSIATDTADAALDHLTIDHAAPSQSAIAAKKTRKKTKDEPPSREMMLLWMERMKNGIDTIKTTFGPEWMYIWMMNEYGRALNARMKLETVVQNHVAELARQIPTIRHAEGHVIHDVTTQPIPLLAMRENQLRQAEGILGDTQLKPNFGNTSRPGHHQRQRSYSAPDVFQYSSDEEGGGMSSRSRDDEDDPAIMHISEASSRQEDLNGQAQQLYKQQAQEYAAALRQLDMDIPSESESGQEVTPSMVSTDKRHRTSSYSGPSSSNSGDGLFAGTPPASAESMTWRNSLRNQLSRLDCQTKNPGTTDDLVQHTEEETNTPSAEITSMAIMGVAEDEDVSIRKPPSTTPGDEMSPPRLPSSTKGSSSDLQQSSSFLDKLEQAHGTLPTNELDDEDDSKRHSIVLPGNLRSSKSTQSPSEHGRDRVSSEASTVRVKTSSNDNFVDNDSTGRNKSEADDISTTSTIQMLEDMDSNRVLASRLTGVGAMESGAEPDDNADDQLLFSSAQTALPKGPQSSESLGNTTSSTTPPNSVSSKSRNKMASEPTIQLIDPTHVEKTLKPKFSSPFKTPLANRKSKSVMPILERIMRQHDLSGNGISQAVATELSLLLWMDMDIGNAWTAMALSLLSTDREACILVQEELDVMELEYGRTDMFAPSVMKRMKYMDALIYEAVRLCPANLGGMKKTTKTVELADAGVQIPKGSNIFFCSPTDLKFDIRGALGKKPEFLGRKYPCEELHGFLPLHGLEVPLMVLQSKVFLMTLLQKFTPVLSMRKNLIRRVKTKVVNSVRDFRGRRQSGTHMDPYMSDMDVSAHSLRSASEHLSSSPMPTVVKTLDNTRGNMSQSEAMSMFTKTPFPEPRRVIHLRPRSLE